MNDAIPSVSDKSCFILQNTNDGGDLHPPHLILIEAALNGCLNAAGNAAFEDLYNQIQNGSYARPWLHGIENLIVDGDGYICWRNLRVEHYSRPYTDDSKASLLVVAERCKHIESLGLIPDARNTIWTWEWMAELTPKHEWLNFFGNFLKCWESGDALLLESQDHKVAMICNGETYSYPSMAVFIKALKGSEMTFEYNDLKALGYNTPSVGQADSMSITNGSLSRIIDLLKQYGVPPTFTF